MERQRDRKRERDIEDTYDDIYEYDDEEVDQARLGDWTRITDGEGSGANVDGSVWSGSVGVDAGRGDSFNTE